MKKGKELISIPEYCPVCGCVSFKYGSSSMHCEDIDFDCGFSVLRLIGSDESMVYIECKNG